MVRGKKFSWKKYEVFPWGKYQGRTIREVGKTDPGYLSWLFWQAPNKFNLDAEIAILILDETLSPRIREHKTKLRAAIIQLFCKTLSDCGDTFDPTVEVVIRTVKEKCKGAKPDEFFAWLETNVGEVVRDMAIESLFKIEDTQILSRGLPAENCIAVLDEVLDRNKRQILRETESKDFYETNGVSFGDW